jgi:hypothetical protein
MTDRETRQLQMLVRVRDFCTARAADFAPTSLAAQLFTALAAAITKIEGLAATQTSGGGAAREGTASRAAARDNLREDLEAISRTARAMEEDTPGITDKFRVPESPNDQALLSIGRAFAADATPIAARFIAHEMPSDFIDDLNADIAAMEVAISKQSSAVGDRVGARAAIDDVLDEAVSIVRKIDPIIRNKYRDDPAALAEWTSASHIERSPRRAAAASGGATPPAPQSP